MRYGFLHPCVTIVIQCLYALNSAEWVKNGAAWFYAWMEGRDLRPTEIRTAKSIGIDIHQVLKWGVVLALIGFGITASWAFYLVAYLIAGNVFTYFFYHTWDSGYRRAAGIEPRRRRCEAFLFSVAFYLVAYAYLYQLHLAGHFRWPDGSVTFDYALYGSITTAFTLTHGDFEPLTGGARRAVVTQLLNTFAFLTIIISDAVPRIEEHKDAD